MSTIRSLAIVIGSGSLLFVAAILFTALSEARVVADAPEPVCRLGCGNGTSDVAAFLPVLAGTAGVFLVAVAMIFIVSRMRRKG